MALINENDEQSARDSLGGLAKVVLSFPALRLVNPVCYGGPVDALYGLTLGDGLGARFLFNAASTAADNGASVIAPTPTPAAGRWLRVAWPYSSGGGGSNEQFVYKAANLTRTAAISTIDPDLQVTLLANSVYDFEILLMVHLPTTASQFHATAQYPDPVADDLNMTVTSVNEDETTELYGRSGRNFTDGVNATGGTQVDLASITYRGTYFVGPAPVQTFGIKWSGMANPDAPTLLKGSSMRFTKRP